MKQVTSDQDYYSVPLEKKVKSEPLIEENKDTKIQEIPSSPSASESEEEQELDPLTVEFNTLKAQSLEAIIEEKKQAQAVPETNFEEDTDTISDEETNTNPPEVKDFLFCSYEKVHRKGNNWKLRLDKCVLQIGGSKEHIFRSATGELDFKKGLR